MVEANSNPCSKCGAPRDLPSCPACGHVFWADLMVQTGALCIPIAGSLLVVAHAGPVWLRIVAVAAALTCAAGFVRLRSYLLKAAQTRQALAVEAAGTPLQPRLWMAATVVLLMTVTAAGFVVYDRVPSREESLTTAPLPVATAAPIPKANPLPVAVTFRPAANGSGQTVHLTGAPGIEPLVVEVTTYRTEKKDIAVPPVVPAGGARARAALWLLLTAEEREKGTHVAVETRVRVQAGVEAPVVWAEKDFLLPPGQAVVLECAGYETLRTATSVPLKGSGLAPGVPTIYRPSTESRPAPVQPPRLPQVDPEQQKRAREALAGQLTTSFRESLVGKGKVLVITNAGPATVPPLRVRVLRPSRVVRGTNEVVAEYTLAGGVGAGQKVEVGWLELDKELQSGDWIELLIGGDVIKSARVD
jgi:hypothetical protein